MPGITRLPISNVPIAVVDVETTGLHPRGDRIVEIAVVRCDPGAEPRLVLDTLVNPLRPMSATEIHGITDDDVRDAPTFADIHELLLDALEESVFAAYNVYFDARFITTELERAGVTDFPPHLCLMYLRRVLDLGGRCTLGDACRAHGVPYASSHVAADDAHAATSLWQTYLARMQEMEIRTFQDLTRGYSYKFLRSFDSPFLTRRAGGSATAPALRPRGPAHAAPGVATPRAVDRIGEYWEALKAALADLVVTRDEIRYLETKRKDLRLSDAEIRSLHARAFGGILADVTEDNEVDSVEVASIATMADTLRALGWCPGDPIVGISARLRPAGRSGLLSRLFR